MTSPHPYKRDVAVPSQLEFLCTLESTNKQSPFVQIMYLNNCFRSLFSLSAEDSVYRGDRSTQAISESLLVDAPQGEDSPRGEALQVWPMCEALQFRIRPEAPHEDSLRGEALSPACVCIAMPASDTLAVCVGTQGQRCALTQRNGTDNKIFDLNSEHDHGKIQAARFFKNKNSKCTVPNYY